MKIDLLKTALLAAGLVSVPVFSQSPTAEKETKVKIKTSDSDTDSDKEMHGKTDHEGAMYEKTMQSDKAQAKADQTDQTDQRDDRRGKLRQVSGTVVMEKEVKARGIGEANKVVLIKTKKGDRRITVDLGPASALQQTDLKLGSMISVEGPVAVAGDRIVVLAKRAKVKDKVMQIDRQGQEQHARTAQKNQAGSKTAE